jgi:hypothetical protein
MANYVMVSAECPCGRTVATRRSDANSTCEKNGTCICPSCKKRVHWSIRGAKGTASYVR